MKSKPRLFFILILILAFPLAAAAEIDLGSDINFGKVELGSSVTDYITIQNVAPQWGEPATLSSVSLETSTGEFTMDPNPVGTVLAPGESIDVAVTFAPEALGTATAKLTVTWINGLGGTTSVNLDGEGVDATGDPPTVQDILDFFDDSVDLGTLVGLGPGSSADGRRGALRNKIKAAGDILLDGGDACEQLLDAYLRCDGLPRPPDFIIGEATGTLAQMILDLMGDLGCE